MVFPIGKPNYSYKHVSAKSPEDLEKLMLQITTDAPYVVSFTAPAYSNAKWTAWYIHDWSHVNNKLKENDND